MLTGFSLFYSPPHIICSLTYEFTRSWKLGALGMLRRHIMSVIGHWNFSQLISSMAAHVVAVSERGLC